MSLGRAADGVRCGNRICRDPRGHAELRMY
jgi:hypothetical protein